MRQEVPKGVLIGLGAVLGIGLIFFIVTQFASGPKMSADDVKRAEMQAQAANQRMSGYIPQGVPGAPNSAGGGEQAARARMQQQQQGTQTGQ